MPEFSTPFSGLANKRNITKDELIRAIRFSIAAEYEAIQVYSQLAESTDDKLAAEVLRDIADEERVHAGEFLRLLVHLDPKESNFYAEGAEEVEEMMQKFGKSAGTKEKSEVGKDVSENLPYCTTAADAEHARAHNDDEPCDDARAGNVEEG